MSGICLKCGLTKAELRHPYELSFATLSHFTSIWVVAMHEDGRLGLGEAVALPGYSWETTESIEKSIRGLIDTCDGAASDVWLDQCKDLSKQSPFAASAVATAIEFDTWKQGVDWDASYSVNFPIAASRDVAKLERTVSSFLQSGQHSIKVKVGKDVEADIQTAKFLLSKFADPDVRFVFDANQGHSFIDACQFCDSLAPFVGKSLAWYEQPFHRDAWQEHAKLIQKTPVPIILDESIYTHDDIDRAQEIGAAGVKLKLMKHPGLDATASLASHAHRKGMLVVIGNGVATDIGNLAELFLLSKLGDIVTPPAEASGFIKIGRPLAFPGLHLSSSGRMSYHHAEDENPETAIQEQMTRFLKKNVIS